MNFRKYRADEADLLIDIAPLIDVVFILLIFFMVTTTFSHESAVEVQLPEASTKPQDNAQPEIVTITIDSNNHYYVNDIALINDTLETLKLALQKEKKKLARPALVINADGNASHQAVIRAMDAARQVGMTRLSFATSYIENP